MLVVLSNNPSIQEILWSFSRSSDEKIRNRLTLVDNPHFYEELPTLPEAYGDDVKIDPTEDFRHARKFYVLTDKPEPVYIMTDQVLRCFGNFWCPQNAIIFKGLGIFFISFPCIRCSCQISVGDSVEKVLSRSRSGAHIVGSVSGSWRPLFQEFPRIVVDCSQLSQRVA